MQTNTPPLELHAGQRITALWALSEAALGGVLHAFRIPFTGLVIGGSAVIFITLIAAFSGRKGAVLKATLIVMAVKALVSPHSPINAYAAVAFQGMLGELLFRYIKSHKTAALLLGIGSLMQSALQKLIVLTVVFGMELWASIDLFGNYVLAQFPFLSGSFEELNISFILISTYVVMHLTAGVVAGVVAPKLSRNIKEGLQNHPDMYELSLHSDREALVQKKKKSRWQKRLTLAILFGIAVSIFILSYFLPVFEKNKGTQALIMVFRSVVIMTTWYFILAPFFLKKLRSFLNKQRHRYAAEIDSVMQFIPLVRRIVYKSWLKSAQFKKTKRPLIFAEIILYHILTVDLSVSGQYEPDAAEN